MREEQLRRFVRVAQKGASSNWMDTLIGLLERRLDNLVFRLGFARSTAGARQLVSHGHVLVDGRRASIGSMVIRVGAKIGLTEKGNQMDCTKAARSSPRLELPSYLMLELGDNSDLGHLVSTPRLEHVPFQFNPTLMAEFYARRGI